MAPHGKSYKDATTRYDRDKLHAPDEAFGLVKSLATKKFDETVEVAFRLGVDPRKADQMIRGTVSLPHGTGKSVRVAVFAAGDQAREAEAAGADVVGADDLVARVEGGFLDFDVTIATPDMMPLVGKLGRVLGPRGLMPNPKTGTVTMDVAKAVKEVKAGKIDFKVDKAGIIHAVIGKASFDAVKLSENASELLNTLVKLKPSTAKGAYIRSITVSSTMSPAVKVDTRVVTVA